MTSLPGEGTVHPVSRDAEIAELTTDFLEASKLLGAAAIKLQAIGERLTALTGTSPTTELTSGPTEGKQNAADIIEPYSRLEDDAAQSQHNLEELSRLHHELPDKIQGIFAPTLRGFQGILSPSMISAEDLTPQFKKPPRRLMAELPSFSENPTKWQEDVSKQTRRHSWSEEDREGAFRCTYHIDYVPTKKDGKQTLHMVGYGFNRSVGGDGQKISLNDKEYDNVFVEVQCHDDQEVHKISAHLQHSHDGYPLSEQTDYNFTSGVIATQQRYNSSLPKPVRTLRYNPDEYRYEGRGHSHLSGDQMLQEVTDIMQVMPSKKG